MGSAYRAKVLSSDINRAFAERMPNLSFSKNYFGTMKKVLTRRVGSMMSSIAKWLEEERSYAITGASILCSALLFVAFLASYIGYRAGKSSFVRVYVGGQPYEMVGLMKIPDKSGDVYAPLYREMK